MAKEKNYSIDGKKIYAAVVALSEKELKEVKNYIALGYELIPVEKKTKTKEEKEAEAAANPYSKQNVEAFLKEKYEDTLYAEYLKRYNEQAGTNRFRKNSKGVVEALEDKPKFLKDGTPKAKGFANCIGWFREQFEWDAEKETYKAKKK